MACDPTWAPVDALREEKHVRSWLPWTCGICTGIQSLREVSLMDNKLALSMYSNAGNITSDNTVSILTTPNFLTSLGNSSLSRFPGNTWSAFYHDALFPLQFYVNVIIYYLI